MVLGENTKLQQQNINGCQWLQLQLTHCMDKNPSSGHEWGHSQGQDVKSIRGSGKWWKDKRESTEREKCPFSELLVTLVLNRVKISTCCHKLTKGSSQQNLKRFPCMVCTNKKKKCSRFSSRFCHAPVIPETAGKADVVLTSMQWHVTATLIVLFQPFNSVTGGNSDTDTSANAMCSHKSSSYISFFFFPRKTINPIWKVLNGTSQYQKHQQMWCGSNTSRGKKCPKTLSIWTWLDLHHCRGSGKFSPVLF